MSTNAISNLASSYVQSLLNPPVQPAPVAVSGGSIATTSDKSQLSPFSQMMNTLQQMQQSNPAEFKQVTAQIASSFETAAKTAAADGNTSAANQLNALATVFTNASTSGQPLNMQSVAKAMGGGGHHHHHHGGGGESSSSSSSSSTAAASPLGQLQAALQSGSTTNEALNPVSIIASTLASAGISST